MTTNDDIRQRVLAQIREDDALALFQRAIQTPSITGNEYEYVQLLADELRAIGLHQVELVDFQPGRPNVWGVLRGVGSERRLLLAGHTDTVGVAGWEDRWQGTSRVSPFAGALEDGAIWGRGAGDMKAGVIASVYALRAIQDAGVRLQGDVAKNRTYTEQSLVLFRDLGIHWAIGFALNNLALAAYHEGELTHALGLVNESVALFRAQKADGSLAEVLITLGQVVRAQGEETAAYTALTESLQFAWAVGPRLMVASALEGVASVVVAQKHAELAVQLIAAASAQRAQIGTPVRPVDQATLTKTLTTARSALGADVFTAVWAEAQKLPLEQILSTIPSVAVSASRC